MCITSMKCITIYCPLNDCITITNMHQLTITEMHYPFQQPSFMQIRQLPYSFLIHISTYYASPSLSTNMHQLTIMHVSICPMPPICMECTTFHPYRLPASTNVQICITIKVNQVLIIFIRTTITHLH